MSELYNKIEELCASQSINVAEMCRRSGARQQSITELKKGRQKGLSAENLNKIATYFNVSVSYLLGTETKKDQPEDELVHDDPELTEYLKDLQSRPELKMLFHTFRSATKEQIEAIVLAWEARNNIDKGE